MHLNYYFLKLLTRRLSSLLANATFDEAFSQEKDELILRFKISERSYFHLRAHLQSHFSCLSFPKEFHRSRRNSVNLFQSLEGVLLLHIRQFQNERAFSMEFENDERLLFKLHGNRSNIIHYRADSVIALFKNSLAKDATINLEKLDRPIERSSGAFLEQPEPRNFYPTFDKGCWEYLYEKGLSQLAPAQQWELLQEFEEQISAGNFYIDQTSKPAFLLYPGSGTQFIGDDPIEAMNLFYRIYHTSFYFEKEKSELLRKLEKAKAKDASYIDKTNQKLEALKLGAQPGQIADIIMANMHQIPPNQKKVTLHNFYTDEPLSIKLNPDLSPQKNAGNYYRKSKNRKIEEEKLQENLDQKEAHLFSVMELLEELETITELRALRKFAKANGLVNEKKKDEVILPYKEFAIAGFKIWVGKNAKANDELTLKYAYKEDTWLHAKDSPGSHVVIKQQAGKEIPKTVLEAAASLAAYYSKRKNDSLCPVIYTPAKYVRKPKGSPAGSVVVSREQVVLVKPLAPSEI